MKIKIHKHYTDLFKNDGNTTEYKQKMESKY